MYDSISFVFPALILILVILLIGLIVFLFLKKIINQYLLLFFILGLIGFIFKELDPYNYIFYLAAIICLILFIVEMFKKKQKKK